MKARIIVGLVAASLLAMGFIACSPGGVGGGSLFPGVSGPLPKFLFTVGDSDIAAFSVDPSTGAVTQLPDSPFRSGSLVCPDEAVPNPSGTFLFVPDACVDGIWVYSISQTTVALTLVTGSPFPTGTDDFDVVQGAVDPTGSFLYVPEDDDCQVLGYTIGATGALTRMAASPFLTSVCNDQGVVMHPSGKFLYVGGQSGGVIAFSINQTTGALTEISGSPFAGGIATKVLAIPTTGNFLYVTDPDRDTVWAYQINTTTGALTPVTGSPFSTGVAGNNPQGVAVSPDGRFVFVANNSGPLDFGNVVAFSVDTSTGALTPVSGSPFIFGPNPQLMAVDPSGQYLYVTITDAGEPPAIGPPGTGGLYVFSIIQSTGALTPVPGSPFTTNVGPEGLAITHQ